MATSAHRSNEAVAARAGSTTTREAQNDTMSENDDSRTSGTNSANGTR